MSEPSTLAWSSVDRRLARDEEDQPCRVCIADQGKFCRCVAACGALACNGDPNA